MTKVMMKLGDYTFSINTAAYQELKRTTPFRWTAQNRIGQRPALQFVGPGQESIELSGTIYPLYKGGIGQLDKMRQQAGAGLPQILVDGLGNIWGKWCIEEVQETQDTFLPGGVPKKQAFSLRLSHYGEDK